MRRFWVMACGSAVLWLVGGVVAGPALGAGGEGELGDPAKADEAAIASAIDQLGAAGYQTREAAQRWLWEVGEPALGALGAAAASDDPEVVMRARNLVELIGMGVPPGADPRVLVQARRLRDGEKGEQIGAVSELAQLGSDGKAVLRKLAPRIEDDGVRQRVLDALFRDASGDARRLISEGASERALSLLREAAMAGSRPAFDDYAALARSMDRLEEAIEGASGLEGEDGPLLRAMLLRASGKPAAAAAELKGEGEAYWRRSLLIEAGDWEGLAAMMRAKYPQPEKLGAMQEARRRLWMIERLASGDFDAANPPAEATESPSGRSRWAEFLMLNGEPRAAAALFDGERDPGALGVVMDLGTLARQRELVEAVMARAAEAADGWGDDKVSPSALGRAAAWLVHVGRGGEGARLLTDAMGEGPTAENQELAAALIRIGFGDRVEGKLAGLINWESDSPLDRELGAAMFGSSSASARARLWANVLGERNLDNAKRLELLRALMAGEASPKALDEASSWFETWWAARQPRDLSELMHAADTLIAHDRDGARWLTERLDKVGGGRMNLLSLGRWLVGHGRWALARQWLGKLLSEDADHVAGHWLLGAAFHASGEREAGARHMRIARRLPLGSAGSRSDLMEAMALTRRAGVEVEGAEPASERRLLLAVGEPGDYSTEVANMTEADVALRQGRFDEAARRSERTRLWLVRDSVGAMWSGMAEIDRTVRLAKARSALAGGRVEAAKAIGRAMGTDYPHAIDATIDLVNAFDEAGEGEAGDAVFEPVFKTLRSGCEMFPKSAALANEAAWLAARCRRGLEAGQALAERAVELDPKLDPAIDTLAEVLFQRGQREAAIEWIDKAIALNPRQAYYKRQKERFINGDPGSDPPE